MNRLNIALALGVSLGCASETHELDHYASLYPVMAYADVDPIGECPGLVDMATDSFECTDWLPGPDLQPHDVFGWDGSAWHFLFNAAEVCPDVCLDNALPLRIYERYENGGAL